MYIAVDIGGTKTEIAFYKSKSLDSKIYSIVFETEKEYEAGKDKLVAEIKKGNPENIKSIVVSNPGTISENGDLLIITNLPDWSNKPLRADLEKEFKTKVVLIQDSTCSGMAELVYGNLESYKRIVHLILGTGLGGSFIEVRNNETSITPIEPGGMIVDVANGRKHNVCSDKGLLEAYVGGGSVEDFYKSKLANKPDDDKVWDEITDYLAVGINNIGCLLKPKIVIIGGGIGTKRKQALSSVVEKVNHFSEFLDPPKVEFTKIQGNSSLAGALAANFISDLVLNI